MSLLRCSSPMSVPPIFVVASVRDGLREPPLSVTDAPRQDRQERERDLRVALEDPAEVPALDAEAGGRLGRARGRRAGELVEQGHLADHLARSEGGELRLLAVTLLQDVDFARADDERAHARVALADDLLTGLVPLIDPGA